MSLPSLNFIAWHDNVGNSRMEPKGAVINICLCSLLYGFKPAKKKHDLNIYTSGKDEIREIIGAVTM